MPYQSDYAEDISSINSGDLTKIEETIFRFATPDDNIISNVVAESRLGLQPEKEFIELHFYQRDVDPPVIERSITVPFSAGYLNFRESGITRSGEGRNIRTVNSSGGEGLQPGDQGSLFPTIQLGLMLWNPENPEDSFYERYLSGMPAGTYNVIINFFADEIGASLGAAWGIEQVSVNGRELILTPAVEGPHLVGDLDQFVDPSLHVGDFRISLIEDFQTNANFKRHRYVFLMNEIKNILQLNYATWEKISDALDARDPTVREFKPEIVIGLRTVVETIVGRINSWIDDEVTAGRHRITEKNLEAFLSGTDGVVAEVLNDAMDTLGFPVDIFVNG